MRLADQRLYEAKQTGRRSPSRQSTDVLLQALRERDPDLGSHLHDVGGLTAAVGARMGLDADELDALRLAGELHDIGKVAIPDAILSKAGPLDRRGVGDRPSAHAHRREDPRRRARAQPGRQARPLESRAVRRDRLSGGHARRRDPARGTDRGRLRRVRRDDRAPSVPSRHDRGKVRWRNCGAAPVLSSIPRSSKSSVRCALELSVERPAVLIA